MSNFICPHCQQIIDDGSDGFTSDREIELEKDIDRLSDSNAKLEKRLYIAVKALEWVEEQADTSTQYDYDPEVILKNIVRDCQEALIKITVIK